MVVRKRPVAVYLLSFLGGLGGRYETPARQSRLKMRIAPPWTKISLVKNFLVIPLILLLAQKPVKKPDVHPDFQFGSYPTSRQAEELLKDDLAREILVAYHAN